MPLNLINKRSIHSNQFLTMNTFPSSYVVRCYTLKMSIKNYFARSAKCRRTHKSPQRKRHKVISLRIKRDGRRHEMQKLFTCFFSSNIYNKSKNTPKKFYTCHFLYASLRHFMFKNMMRMNCKKIAINSPKKEEK